MADRYSVDSQAAPYGSVGGASIRALQQELLRRQAFEDAARAEDERRQELQLQHERQARLDARQAGQDDLDRKVKLETLAGAEENRSSLIAQRKEATEKAQREEFTSTHRAGSSLTPAEQEEATRLHLGGLQLVTPGMPRAKAPVNLPGTLVEPGTGQELPAAPVKPEGPAVTEPPTATYLGTEKQQKDEADLQATAKQRKAAEDFVAGKHDEEFADVDPAALAAAKLTVSVSGPSGLAAAVASIVKPPKAAATPQETKAAHDIKMQELMSKIDQGYTPTAAEAADLKTWRKFNATVGETQANREISINLGADRTDQRTAATQLNRAQAGVQRQIEAERKNLATDLERVDRAKTLLASKNFVADSVAAPEFLQISAGGMGSGLRMTDAELKRVQASQSKFQQWRADLAKLPGAKLAGIEQTTIGERMRKDMGEALALIEGARVRKAKAEEEFLRKLKSTTDIGQVQDLEADWFEASRSGGQLKQSGGAGAPAPASSKYSVTIKD